MNRDDRLFAVIGGAVVTGTTACFLLFSGGITGTLQDRGAPRVTVSPPVGIEERAPVVVEPLTPAADPTSDVVLASNDEPGPSDEDALMRSLFDRFPAGPEAAAWLLTDGMVDRFVGAVEAVADGYSPREELDFLGPQRAFYVREEGHQLFITAGSYLRYDLVAEVFGAIDTEVAVGVYHKLEPRIRDARRSVAWHRGDFEDRLRQAVDHLLDVEVPDGPIAVERRTMTYAFADDELERLSGAQRQLLRMGSRNARSIQRKLHEIRAAFGWPEPEPAPETRHAVLTGDEAVVPQHETIAKVLVEDDAVGVADEGVVLEPAGDPLMTPFVESSPEMAAPMLLGTMETESSMEPRAP